MARNKRFKRFNDRRAQASIAAWLLMLCATLADRSGAVVGVNDPPPSGLAELWVLARDGMAPSEQVLAQTLQGLVGRREPKIWLRGRSMYAVVEDQLRREGVRLREAASVWDLVRQYRQSVNGSILYRLGTPSLNVATSLSGLLDGIAVDESLLERARSEGLTTLVDAREMDDRQAWASPLRGQFPMTWEISPLLAEVAPRVAQYLYATSKETDAFVSGPGAPGYTFPHLQPDPGALARQAASLLRRADLPVVSVLNANEGNLAETVPLLDLPRVRGVLYKDYSPYHRRKGAVFWRRGKPCVSSRCVLWERLMEPEDVAREVARMPTAPRTSVRADFRTMRRRSRADRRPRCRS